MSTTPLSPPTMESPPTVQNGRPPPFPDSPRSVDYKALGFVIGVVCVVFFFLFLFVGLCSIKWQNPLRMFRRKKDPEDKAGCGLPTLESEKIAASTLDFEKLAKLEQQEGLIHL
ncbi:hypothetical protein FNV43_RR09982 [Rhamnella rubrinervis]|uniref:Uncharacterized protein n=1 Tax=Rhamnella rubrinervis TaxID=2594499 RepID=A0A8K0MKA6_9ROSA|nr:hypothetical protein FNV43_RR09982 [Rhamnella rubrinervis]